MYCYTKLLTNRTSYRPEVIPHCLGFRLQCSFCHISSPDFLRRLTACGPVIIITDIGKAKGHQPIKRPGLDLFRVIPGLFGIINHQGKLFTGRHPPIGVPREVLLIQRLDVIVHIVLTTPDQWFSRTVCILHPDQTECQYCYS